MLHRCGVSDQDKECQLHVLGFSSIPWKQEDHQALVCPLMHEPGNLGWKRNRVDGGSVHRAIDEAGGTVLSTKVHKQSPVPFGARSKSRLDTVVRSN